MARLLAILHIIKHEVPPNLYVTARIRDRFGVITIISILLVVLKQMIVLTNNVTSC